MKMYPCLKPVDWFWIMCFCAIVLLVGCAASNPEPLKEIKYRLTVVLPSGKEVIAYTTQPQKPVPAYWSSALRVGNVDFPSQSYVRNIEELDD